MDMVVSEPPQRCRRLLLLVALETSAPHLVSPTRNAPAVSQVSQTCPTALHSSLVRASGSPLVSTSAGFDQSKRVWM
eukprot:2292090-Amphidinium_carterae.1